MKRNLNDCLLAAIMLGAMISPVALHAATMPYTEDFNSQAAGASAPLDNSSSAWIETSDANWSIITGGLGGSGALSDKAYHFANNNSATNNAMTTASITKVALAANANFSVSSQFKMLSNTVISGNSNNGELRVGLVALGNSALTSAYLADIVIATTAGGVEEGLLRMTRLGGSLTQTGGGIAVNSNDTYLISLTGEYVGSSLNLKLTVTDLATQQSASLSAVDTNPIIASATQSYFGYRNRNFSGSSTNAGATSASMNVDFDSFQTQPIPEPSMAMGGSVLALGLLARKKR